MLRSSQFWSLGDTGLYVDTARPYHIGQSEPFVGRALADGYREHVKLATKLPSWLIEKREDMGTYLNVQLVKLKTDHIDYYLVHALVGDLWDTVEKLGVADFLDKAKTEGASEMQVSRSTVPGRISARSQTPMTGTSARSSTTSWTKRTRLALQVWNMRLQKVLVSSSWNPSGEET